LQVPPVIRLPFFPIPSIPTISASRTENGIAYKSPCVKAPYCLIHTRSCRHTHLARKSHPGMHTCLPHNLRYRRDNSTLLSQRSSFLITFINIRAPKAFSLELEKGHSPSRLVGLTYQRPEPVGSLSWKNTGYSSLHAVDVAGTHIPSHMLRRAAGVTFNSLGVRNKRASHKNSPVRF
jgi:hypothetical protein